MFKTKPFLRVKADISERVKLLPVGAIVISTQEQENVIPYCKLANRFKGFGVQMNTSTHKPVTLTILSLHIALAKKKPNKQ